MQTVDQKIYKMLLQQDQQGQQNDKPKQYGSAFLVHVLFKAIPIGLMLLRSILIPLLSNTIVIQLILLFVVLDFWLTKNVNGKRMIGVRWAFEENQYGDEKFQYEGRINEEHVSSLSSKLFWLIQVVYTIIPIVFVVFGILTATTLLSTKFGDVIYKSMQILLWIAIMIGGGSNLFLFWKAARGVGKRRNQLNAKLGQQFCSQMGGATIVSYM